MFVKAVVPPITEAFPTGQHIRRLLKTSKMKMIMYSIALNLNEIFIGFDKTIE